MRRVSGFILTILGAFLLVVAVLLRVWVAPSVIEFPLDEYQIVQLAGTGSYFSPAREKELVGVSVLVTETTKGADVAGSGGAAVWDGFVAVQDTTNRTPIAYVAFREALNRRTGELVDCCGAYVTNPVNGKPKYSVRMTGIGFVWPFGAQRQTYLVFDIGASRTAPARYAGPARIGGILTYRYVEKVTPTRFGTEPRNSFGQSPGEYYSATNTYFVDPETGMPLRITENQEVTLASGGVTQLVSPDLSLTETAHSVRAAVSSDDGVRGAIALYESTLPLIGLTLGLVFLAIGILLVQFGGEAPKSEFAWVWRRELNHYPSNGRRVLYLTVTVLATITLYYELYVGGSVSTLLLVNVHISFTFFVVILAVGNLIGAFGSLFAGLADRLRPRQPAGLRAAHQRDHGRVRAANRDQQVVLQHRFFRGQRRRGHHAGSHACADPRLLPAGRPRHRNGLLDRWAGARQPDRHGGGHEHHPGVRPRSAVLDPRVPHLRDRRPRRVPDHAGRAAGTVTEAARSADGDHARPGAHRSQGQRARRRLDRRVRAAARLLHVGRVRPDLPVHRVRLLDEECQRTAQLGVGLQRHRGDPDRHDRRPGPGAEAVHGDRRGRHGADGRGGPGGGRSPPRLLHARGDPGAAVAVPRHGLHPVAGRLHRDRGGEEPGADRHRARDLGMDYQGPDLRRVPGHPVRHHLRHAPCQLRAHGAGLRDHLQERDRVRPVASCRRGHRVEVQDSGPQRPDVRARARGDPGPPGALPQAERLPQPVRDPAQSRRPGDRGGGRRRQGPWRSHHDRRQQGSHRGRDLRRTGA